MSHWYPLWFPPSPAALKAGSDAVAKAMAAPTKTDREKDYIAADRAFYRDNDKLDHRTRALAYEKAMEQVYLKYPEDREAAVFYALALVTTALPTDKTYANQKKAAEILNKVWKEQPNHPGVVHYLIHSDDSAKFARAGLDAAICYSKIAPDVPHALHMPSHIFTRLGMWQQSIDFESRGQCRSARLCPRRASGRRRSTVKPSIPWIISNTPICRPRRTARPKRWSTSWSGLTRVPGPTLPTAYAVAAIPVRFALERRDWPAAVALSAPKIGFPLERFPWAEAMLSFARALGDARTGDIAGAHTEIAQLRIARRQAEGQRHVLGQPG